jgi:hypothetical protein
VFCFRFRFQSSHSNSNFEMEKESKEKDQCEYHRDPCKYNVIPLCIVLEYLHMNIEFLKKLVGSFMSTAIAVFAEEYRRQHLG